MKITHRLLPKILIQAMLALILVSCTNAASVDPTLVQQATLTPLPSSTATIAPTATITIEPTQSAGLIADSLGLVSEPLYGGREFGYREIGGADYLVDLYNDAPKAVLEDGAWRRLDYNDAEDAEAMYGALVPEGEYIRTGTLGDSNGTIGRLIGPRFLGDWEVRPIDYNGKQINLYYLLAGLRDGGGRLHVVRIAFDSPDIGEHDSTFKCFVGGDEIRSPGSGIPVNWPLAETLSRLRPGERVGIWVYDRNRLTEFPYHEHPDYPLILNSRQSDLVTKLYNQHPEVFQGMSAGERAALDELLWPDRVLTFSASPRLIVSRPTEAECAN